MDTIIKNDDEISSDDYLNKPYFDKEDDLNSPSDISSGDNLIFINTDTEEED